MKKKDDENVVQSLFSDITDGVITGIKDSANVLLEGGQFITGLITESTKTLLDTLNKTTEFVVDQVNGGIGYFKDGVYYIGDKAVEGTVVVRDGVLMIGENVIGTVINTTKFISDSKYRDEVGIPWLKELIDSNQKIIVYQMQQNQKSMEILFRYSLGEDLKPEELEIAKTQLIDMIKLVPAFAIFLLPGGMVLLPILAKLLPWELIPDLKPPTKKENAN